MPFAPTKRPPRRCVLCGHPELTNERGQGRFLLVPDPEGRGPVCPPLRGCGSARKQRPRSNPADAKPPMG